MVESFVFNTPSFHDGKPLLKMAAKRYVDRRQSDDGITVLLAHGTGTHKEQWEPMLHKLFEIRSTKSPSLRIREAWAFDWQDHGHSAVMNSEILKTHPNGVSIAQWAQALVAFVNSKYAVRHRLVVIGHSAGASAWLYSTKFFPFKIPYLAITLVEPELIDSDTFHKTIKEQEDCRSLLQKITGTRHDEWSTKKEAFEYFSERAPWNAWDDRVLNIYVDQGLRVEPLEDPQRSRVVLKCNKVHEGASYRDGEYETRYNATDQIAKVCNNVPIHVIYGEINDFVPRYLQASPVDRLKGRKVASIVRIPHAGHMIPQQRPDELAQAISNLLNDSPDSSIRIHL